MYSFSTDVGQFGLIFGPSWDNCWCLFGIIFWTSFLEASWHAFWSILGPLCGGVWRKKQQKTLRGRSISRFGFFRAGSLSKVILGSIFEAFLVQKTDPKRQKNDTRKCSKFEGGFGRDLGPKKDHGGHWRGRFLELGGPVWTNFGARGPFGTHFGHS